MYRLWKEDPSSVHPSWNVYFSGMSKGLRSEDSFRPPPNLLDISSMSTQDGDGEMSLGQGGGDVQDHMKVRSCHSNAESCFFGVSTREVLAYTSHCYRRSNFSYERIKYEDITKQIWIHSEYSMPISTTKSQLN